MLKMFRLIILIVVVSIIINIPVLFRKNVLLETESDINNEYAYTIFAVSYQNQKTSSVLDDVVAINMNVFCLLIFGAYYCYWLNGSCIYSLIRYNNRLIWYVRRTVALFVYIAFYTLLQILVPAVIIITKFNPQIRIGTKTLIAVFLVMYSFNAVIVMIMNIISMIIDNKYAFIITYGIIILLFVVCAFVFSKEESLNRCSFLLPTEAVRLKLINSDGNTFEALFNINQKMFKACKMNYMYSICLVIILAFIVTRINIGLYDKKAIDNKL